MNTKGRVWRMGATALSVALVFIVFGLFSSFSEIFYYAKAITVVFAWAGAFVLWVVLPIILGYWSYKLFRSLNLGVIPGICLSMILGFAQGRFLMWSLNSSDKSVENLWGATLAFGLIVVCLYYIGYFAARESLKKGQK